MVLDLKVAFFTSTSLLTVLICLHLDGSRHISISTINLDHFTTRFRDSPHFFGQALQRDLQTLDLGSTILLQHVDDLLLCSSSYHNSLVHTAMALNALGNWGYWVLLSKAHIASTTVNSLGLLLTPTSKIIPAQRLRALTQTPPGPKPRGNFFLY